MRLTTLFDAHVTFLADKRPSMTALKPFRDRVRIFSAAIPDLFGTNRASSAKLVKALCEMHRDCQVPRELQLFLCISHYFRETARGYVTVLRDDRRLHEARAVSEAGVPEVS